jgi:hypothetical protein
MSIDAAIKMAKKAPEERGGVPRRHHHQRELQLHTRPIAGNLSISANAEAAQR